MKKSKLFIAILVVIVAILTLTLVACDDGNGGENNVNNNNGENNNQNVTAEYTVTFDSDGGGAVASQTVKSGKKAVEPTDPTYVGHDFAGWYEGKTLYDFDTPVTKNITLKAAWTDKEYTVTFDSDGGSDVEAKTVVHGNKVEKPEDPAYAENDLIGWYDGKTLYNFNTPVTQDITLTAVWGARVTFDSNGGSRVTAKTVELGNKVVKPENPARNGYYFEGWYLEEEKYDFSEAVTDPITLKAKWADVNVIDAAFVEALGADYSNFTSQCVYSQKDDRGNDITITEIFKQTANLAYWNPGPGLYNEHFVVFSDAGTMLAMYYLNRENNAWEISNLVDYADFVVALDLENISLVDVEYIEGVYHVCPESIGSVVYALFHSQEAYNDFYIQIENGRISLVGGSWDDVTHVQSFYDFGETELELPDSIPAVSVVIETRDKDIEAGVAIDADELIRFLFNVKALDKKYTVTFDMVDFGGLNLNNPAVGTYTITLTIETWDGETHSDTATVTVEVDQSDDTFEEIFAKNYDNVTISAIKNAASTTETTYKRNGAWYKSLNDVTNSYYFVESDQDHSLTKYKYNSNDETFVKTNNAWFVLPRLDLLFALNSSIFEQVGESKIYEAKNKTEILPVIQGALLMKNYIIDETQDYSIALTVSMGRISKITISCKYKTSANAEPTAFTMECTLSDFGTTELDIPDTILNDRNAAPAAQTACIDEKQYAA